MTTAASLVVEGVSFRYPGARDQALSELNFEIQPGQRVGLLGPNGAGKSTLMRLVCGYLPLPSPARGKKPASIQVAGLDVAHASLAVRERVGYLPEQVPLYEELRVQEHLAFRAAVKRFPRRQRGAEIRRVASLAGLEGMLRTPIHKLSRGYRQRVGIADALLGAPPLVVLDEPTVGLDPNQVQGIRSMLRGLGGGQTLIFSSHILAEVEALCDRIIILSRGEVVADESLSEATATETLLIEWDAEGLDGSADTLVRAAWAASGHEGVPNCQIEAAEGRVRVRVDGVESGAQSFAHEIGRQSRDRGLVLLRLEPGRRRLARRFAEATGFGEDGAAG